MPDITMCCNCLCPIRKKCYRYRAVPDQYRQSWCNFQPKTVMKNNKYETRCLRFREVNEATDKTIPFDVVENRYDRDEKWKGLK